VASESIGKEVAKLLKVKVFVAAIVVSVWTAAAFGQMPDHAAAQIK
jgi:hypothetical protein